MALKHNRYTKITLLETKDISDIVMSIRGNTPFTFDENSLNDMDTLNEVIPPENPKMQIAIDNIDRTELLTEGELG